MNKFKIELVGTECNGYPHLIILHNQKTVYNNFIKGFTEIEIDLPLEKNNVIVLKGIEKSLDQDTRLDDNGNIIHDKSILINNIWFDNIAMTQQWIQTLPMQVEQKIFSCNFGMWENGFIKFDLNLPLLDWIIYEKFIKFENKNRQELNDPSGESRFDYKYVEDKIRVIKKLLNAQNLNF